MIASLNNPSAHTKPLILTNLTSAKHEPIVTSSPNPICKPSTSSQQLQLINLNNIAKANCSPIKTINLMSHKPAKSNLLTTVDKIDEDQEENFLSKISESEPGSSNMLDDSLTSLQWLQSLNIMKNTTMVASSCSLSPNSQTSDKFSPSLDCDLDSATIPAASVPKSVDCGKNFHMSYPPLSPPLSVQCSASPQSTCSSNASTKRRSKKTDTNKTVQQLQHQLSAPAILQPSKSQSIMTNSNSAGSVFRSSFLKDRDEYRTNSDVKPPYSYSQLIILSMKESKQSKMTLQMIYDWIIGNFSYFKKKDANWQVTFKNSIRHNLSLNKCFRKIARQKDEPGKGGFWTLDPEFERQLDESNSLGVINTKSYKRKRKNCDDQEDKKKAKPDLVQYNEMENCDFVRSDANLSQVNKAQHGYNYGTNVTSGYMDPQMNHVQHQHQPQSVNSTHFDFSDTFGNSFQSNGMSYDEPNLFNFEANFPTLELDQFTDSSCTSNSSPEDLVSGLLKKNMVSSHDNELSDLFDIASQFNLDENFNATSLINPSNEKKTIDLTVQGTGIRQPKWWTDNLLDLEAGLINVQPHIIQDDECDSAMFISSHGSLDFGLNVDDLEFLSVDPSKDNSSNQQGPQQARKRIYTHQNKLNPAIQKTTRTKQNFS